jgi:hypothetical protein
MNRPEREDAALSPPDTKAGKLQRASLDLLREHERDGAIPTNGRFLFYELEQRGVIPKAYLAATGGKRARQPGQDISDGCRRRSRTRSRRSAKWSACVSRARIDCWGGEPPPLNLCEARATAGVLERLAADYLCPATMRLRELGLVPWDWILDETRRRAVRRLHRHRHRAAAHRQ